MLFVLLPVSCYLPRGTAAINVFQLLSIPEFSPLRVISTVGRVECRVLIVPPAPLLVPELGGYRGAVVPLRDAVTTALAWATAPSDGHVAPDSALAVVSVRSDRGFTAVPGTFQAWGVNSPDVEIDRNVQASQSMLNAPKFLPELLANRLLGQRSRAFSRLEKAFAAGATTILVMADGPSGLTSDSPHGLIDAAVLANSACREVFVDEGAGYDGNLEVLDSDWVNELALQIGWETLPLWRELALKCRAQMPSWRMFYDDEPFGIGYFVAGGIFKSGGND